MYRIATDNNVDNTSGILNEWASNVRDVYSAVTVEESADPEYSPDGGLYEWTDERYIHIIALRQKALDYARRTWADNVFVSHTACALVESLFKGMLYFIVFFTYDFVVC